MRQLSLYALAALLASTAPAAEPIYTYSQVEMVPIGTLQLGEAAFASPEVFKKLDLEKGEAVLLFTDGGKSLQAFLYPIDRSPESISLKRASRDSLEVEPGEATVHMRLLEQDEIEINRADGDIHLDSYTGDPEKWPGMVVGAPHGDCDMYTGEIVELLSRDYGIPAVAAYGPRISYIGRWIDVNRPLQREPRPLYGIQPDRTWTSEAEAVYTDFKSRILASTPPNPEGEVPLDLYLDLHGHDLTVKKPNGKVVGRRLTEGMARGFNLEEVRKIKAAFDEAFQSEYGEDAPPSYWGNLPEDRVYTAEGVETEFFYSGTGGRVYGALASDVARRCVHIETPNALRLDPKNREKTAKALAKFLSWMRDNMLADKAETNVANETADTVSAQWIPVEGGSFVMGAEPGEGWTSLGPPHIVRLSPFEISSTEVTNAEFADFLNKSIADGTAVLEGNSVRTKDGTKWAQLRPSAPLSRLYNNADTISVSEGYENHPVVNVTWNGAVAYAESQEARLPTEAEWEYIAGWDPEQNKAARWVENQDRSYASLPAGNFMHSDFNEENRREPGTTPVGSFPEGKSPIGCYDTTGNVWEWTADWFAGYSKSDDVSVDPTGPSSGTMKSIRGGAWDTEPSTVTPIFRLGASPDANLPTLGFRLAR